MPQRGFAHISLLLFLLALAFFGILFLTSIDKQAAENFIQQNILGVSTSSDPSSTK